MSAGRCNRDLQQQPAQPVSSAIMSRYQTLRRLLIKTSYTSPFPPHLFLSTAPPALTLPILSHAFLAYHPQLTAWFLGSGMLVSSSTFSLSSLWTLLHGAFGYHPQLSQQQFASERGYVERKLQLLCDVLQMCVAKAEELEREKGGVAASAGKGGVPRVAVLVRDKQKRRSAGEEHEERKEQAARRQTQPSPVVTQRQQKREECKVQRYEDEDEDEDNDGGVPQRRQHQHISFTHDDSSQPLSPSHLSPRSISTRSPHRLSPPPHSHSHSHSHSSPSSSSASSSNKAAMDPLLALHQQLHRISHRTNQLAHNQQPHPTHHSQHDRTAQSPAIDQLVERIRVLETSMREEVSGLRQEVAEMRQRLAVVEQRERERDLQQPEAAKAVKVEETKEAGDTEPVTRGGGSGGGGSGKESGGADSASALPSDMSEFLTHMNDRLSSTAKLLESSRRARGRTSEGE